MDVPVGKAVIEAHTSEETWEAIGQLYTRVRPGPGNTPTTLAAQSWSTPDLAVDVTHLAAAGTGDAEGVEQFVAVTWLGGGADLDFHRAERHSATRGDCCLAMPGVPYRFTFDDISCLTVRLPLDVVGRVAHELTGTSSGALRFTSAQPLSARHARSWNRTAAYLRERFADPDGLLTHPLIHRQLVDHAVAVALTTFPNTTMRLGEQSGPGAAPPAVVRRAIDYIDAHASEPITITDIAGAARIGVRGLQAAFRRHRDETPLQYLRTMRMERAHRDLQQADPSSGDTVAAVAARWGFTHAGRFSVEYRRHVGCSPGETLRR